MNFTRRNSHGNRTMAQSAANWRNTHTHVVRSASSAITEFGMDVLLYKLRQKSTLFQNNPLTTLEEKKPTH